jgi:hypothetical protein
MPRCWNASTLLNANEAQDHNTPTCTPTALHRGLNRAQSSLATQLRTEHIGLRAYLHRRRVPEVESPACLCGYQSQNVKHVLTRCDRWSSNRGSWLQLLTSSQYHCLLQDSKNISHITRWIIQEGFFKQFQLAQPVKELLNQRAAKRKQQLQSPSNSR